MDNFNPFNLVPLIINGKSIDGRPFEFDSSVSDQKTMKNAFGCYVKPTKVVSICPDCGQGLTISVRFNDPPFSPFSYSCEFCRSTPPPIVDIFVNPVVSGRVPIAELDPLLHNPDNHLKVVSDTFVSDRFAIPDVADAGLVLSDNTSHTNLLEKAEDLFEESDSDFDDRELIDE